MSEKIDKRKIKYLGDLQKISCKPGDKFVLITDEILSQAQISNLKAEWKSLFLANNPLLVIPFSSARLGMIEVPETMETP